MFVIKEVCEKVGSWCLENVLFFVILEFCFMCSGVMILFCVVEVYFGVYDLKGGIVGILMNFLEDE